MISFCRPDGKPLENWKLVQADNWEEAWKKASGLVGEGPINESIVSAVNSIHSYFPTEEKDVWERAWNLAWDATWKKTGHVRKVTISDEIRKAAAYDSARLCVCLLVTGYAVPKMYRNNCETWEKIGKLADKSKRLAEQRMKVWKKGYALFGEHEGKLIVCSVT